MQNGREGMVSRISEMVSNASYDRRWIAHCKLNYSVC